MVKLSFEEEVGNVITHGVMAAIFLILIPFSAVYAYINGGTLFSFWNKCLCYLYIFNAISFLLCIIQ